MKKVLIIPGNTFVSRNYFSSPMIESLKRISIKDNIKFIVAEIESNPIPEETFDKLKKIFEDKHNIQFVKLIKNPESAIQRIIWYLKNNFFHKALTYRFNEINNFITQKRFKEITNTRINKNDEKYLWSSDIWPNYFGFPFPKSKLIFKIFYYLFSSFLFSNNKTIDENLRNLKPDLIILGDIQNPVSFSYFKLSKKYKIKICGNVRTWDHLTKNGPVVNGLDEYWVWNPIMKEELIKFHNIDENKIFEVGSPQFDYYLNSKEANKDLIEYFNVEDPINEFSLKTDSSLLFFATNRPHRGIGEESIIHHICENIALGVYPDKDITIILRSHPYDNTFEKRFEEFKKYPFVRLFSSPSLTDFIPSEFREDMIKVNLLLERAKLVLCGQSTFAIDSACTDTPVINISFEGDIKVDEKLSVKNRYNVDHYQKLLSFDGTKIADNFESLDEKIIEYLIDPTINNQGRNLISRNFAGFSEKPSSERISERILLNLNGGNGRI